MHTLFGELLNRYVVKEELIAPFLERAIIVWNDINKENVELEAAYKKQLSVVEEKLENIEESYYVTKDMGQEQFNKYYPRYNKEHQEITDKLAKLNSGISNPIQAIEKAIRISTELSTIWVSSDIGNKEKLQKLLFPDGIIFNRKNGEFRTEKVNSVFQLIASLQNNSGENNKGQTGLATCLSLSAEG